MQARVHTRYDRGYGTCLSNGTIARTAVTVRAKFFNLKSKGVSMKNSKKRQKASSFFEWQNDETDLFLHAIDKVEHHWLKVPYSEKDEVKKVGGMWDSLVKMWWVPKHVPSELVKKWKIKQ